MVLVNDTTNELASIHLLRNLQPWQEYERAIQQPRGAKMHFFARPFKHLIGSDGRSLPWGVLMFELLQESMECAISLISSTSPSEDPACTLLPAVAACLLLPSEDQPSGP